ncbi:MAG: transporter [Calditerrivibrio sp.]|nr:transporter [Calditerrivibrio sp.]
MISLPILIVFVGGILAFSTYYAGKRFFKDNTLNILSFSAGTGNTGYFGIPLAFMLLDERLANVYVFSVLGSLIYESTIGFFIIAKGSYNIRDSLKRVLKLPAIYAMILGLLFNFNNIPISEDLLNYLDYFKGAYAILGMMMIGMSLSGINKITVDKVFIATALIIKFLVYPILILLIIYIDRIYIGVIPEELHKVLFLFAVPPMAGNVVAIATILRSNPEKAAIAVIISTLVSIFTIPIMVAYFMP